MGITNETSMPSDEELTVPQEITLSTPWFKAISVYMAKNCENEAKQYMLLRNERADPRKTLKEAAELTACGIKFLQKLKKTCHDETTNYANCIDQASYKMYITNCRETQRYLDRCVEDKLGIERPKMGYFSKLHVHDPGVPKPARKERDYKAEAAKLMDELPKEYVFRKDYKKYEDYKSTVIQK